MKTARRITFITLPIGKKLFITTLWISFTCVTFLITVVSIRLFVFEYQENVIYPGLLHPDPADMEFGAQVSVVIAILLTIIILIICRWMSQTLSVRK